MAGHDGHKLGNNGNDNGNCFIIEALGSRVKGDPVSRLIIGITRVAMWIIRLINLLGPPDPASAAW